MKRLAGIDANTNRKLASRIKDLYEDAEARIFEDLSKRLISGVNLPDWERRKLQQIQAMRKDVLRQINILNEDMPPEVLEIITEGYILGSTSIDTDLIDQGVAETREGQLFFKQVIGIIEGESLIEFGKIDRFKVEAIAKALEGLLKATHPQILRSSNDIYRSVITEAVVDVAIGAKTRQQSVQSSLNKFANIGVTSFIDTVGRRWNLGAYADMATRTGLVQANLAGTQDRMEELGLNLVIVSKHSASSDLCLPWEDKILIVDE